jgi:hypothetical protein
VAARFGSRMNPDCSKHPHGRRRDTNNAKLQAQCLSNLRPLGIKVRRRICADVCRLKDLSRPFALESPAWYFHVGMRSEQGCRGSPRDVSIRLCGSCGCLLAPSRQKCDFDSVEVICHKPALEPAWNLRFLGTLCRYRCHFSRRIDAAVLAIPSRL